ncbi:methylated-DNA--[protein]-cysteine S-methyltransferase [Planctomycetota bacterium]|nr:methylated-DNA--[protein]-cysteine S-methyltransferase [Planctomycetota bacterium]
MHNRLAISSVESPLGALGLAAGEHGLIALTFSRNLKKLLPTLLAKKDSGRGKHHPWEVLEQACREIAEYTMSARTSFDVPLDLSTGTEFQRTIWRFLLRIKFGKSTSYQKLAVSAGKPKSARAVGNAVGANPLGIIIPCHRVLAANGRLGGFSGGLAMKKKLLAIEDVAWK